MAKPPKVLNKLYILILALVIAIGGGFTLIKPLKEESEKNKAQADTKEEIKMMKEEEVAEAKALIKEYATLDENAPELVTASRAVPENPTPQELLVTMEDIAFSSGIRMKLNDISFDAAQLGVLGGQERGSRDDAKLLNPYTFSLNLQGDSADLKKFLEKLETSIRVIDVQSLSVAAGVPGQETFTIAADAYYIDPSALIKDETVTSGTSESDLTGL